MLLALIASSVFQPMTSILRLILLTLISAVYLYLVFDSQSSLFTVQDTLWELTG